MKKYRPKRTVRCHAKSAWHSRWQSPSRSATVFVARPIFHTPTYYIVSIPRTRTFCGATIGVSDGYVHPVKHTDQDPLFWDHYQRWQRGGGDIG